MPSALLAGNVLIGWKARSLELHNFSCRETYFQYDKPFDPSEFGHFRKCLGTDGAEKVVKLSISLFEKKEAEENEVLIDTTVHEKNITYPIDARLHKKIIEGCWRIAEKEGINVTVQNYWKTRLPKGRLINNRDYRQMTSTNTINIAFSRFDDSKVRNEFWELLSRQSTSNTRRFYAFFI